MNSGNSGCALVWSGRRLQRNGDGPAWSEFGGSAHTLQKEVHLEDSTDDS